MFDKEAIQELQASAATYMLAEAAKEAIELGHATVFAPEGYTRHDLESLLDHRRHARGTMSTNQIESFAAFAGAHKGEGARVFVDPDTMRAVAVLNLGTDEKPGHADNHAVFSAEKTAAYKALQQISGGQPRSQLTVAEFLEDWSDKILCFREGAQIAVGHATAAVRKVTIEAMRKLEATEQQLSASRSTLESISAASTVNLPTHIYFTTVPYMGLSERCFVLRLGVLTSGDKPALNLRTVNQEKHDEEMAVELVELVRKALGDSMPAHVGKYEAKR